MTIIHKTAIVSKKAEIDPSVEIWPNVIIEDNVEIKKGTRILANAYITGYTTIGENNEIHIGAVIGHDPQDYSFNKSARSYVEIGDGNIIREYCTIHRGTKPETKTVIGNNNFLMGGVHIAHNCRIGDNVIMANYSALAGYVTVGNNAFISGGVMIHQFVTVGRLVMLSGNGRFSRNIPPFLTGLERNLVGSINIVGLRRAGLEKESIHEIQKAYKILYLSDLSTKKAIEEMEACGFVSSEAREFIEFVKNARLPIAKHRSKNKNTDA